MDSSLSFPMSSPSAKPVSFAFGMDPQCEHSPAFYTPRSGLLASLAWLVAAASCVVSLSHPFPSSLLFSTHWPRNQITSLIYSLIGTLLWLLVSLRVKAQIPYCSTNPVPLPQFIPATLTPLPFQRIYSCLRISLHLPSVSLTSSIDKARAILPPHPHYSLKMGKKNRDCVASQRLPQLPIFKKPSSLIFLLVLITP